MAYPKTYAPVAYPVSAFLEAVVDIGSAGASTTLVVEVAAPRSFRYGRPVIVQQKLGETAVDAKLAFGIGQVVYNSGKKIRFRVENHSTGAIDPASGIYQFLQL
jgi:hypothetical protein